MAELKHRELWNRLNSVGKDSLEPHEYRKLQDKQTVTDYHKWLKDQIKLAASAKPVR